MKNNIQSSSDEYENVQSSELWLQMYLAKGIFSKLILSQIV